MRMLLSVPVQEWEDSHVSPRALPPRPRSRSPLICRKSSNPRYKSVQIPGHVPNVPLPTRRRCYPRVKSMFALSGTVAIS